MAKISKQKVNVRFILFYDYNHFFEHRTEWTTLDKEILICRPSYIMKYDENITFGELARIVEFTILGYLSTQLQNIEFKFKHDIMSNEDVLHKVGLKKGGAYDLWIYAPHLCIAIVNRDIKSHREQIK